MYIVNLMTFKLNDLCIGTGAKGFNLNIFQESIKLGFKTFDLSSIYHGTQMFKNRNYLINNNDLILVYKLWINELGNFRYNGYIDYGNQIKEKCLKIMRDLNISKINVLLIHWPLKVNSETNITEEYIPEEIWIQLEELVLIGLVDKIGLSNFGVIDMQRILNNCRIKPYINQIEMNPYNTNLYVKDFCLKNDIIVMAHSPFGFGWKDGHLDIFNDDILKFYSNKYNVSVPVIIVKWLISLNVIPVIGTSCCEHLKEFILLQKFNLLDCEIQDITIKCNKNNFLYNSIYNIHNNSYNLQYNTTRYTVLVGDENTSDLYPINTDDINFLEKCKVSLTNGPGYLIIKGLFLDKINILKQYIPPPPKDISIWSRWNGLGAVQNNLINMHPVYSELIDNNLIGGIVESLLGWDCKLDNTAYTISRCGKYANFFGPHQDSPFEQNPGALLPPCNYPLVMQTICMIDDFTENNGPFFLVPHSHKSRERITLQKGQFPNEGKKILGSSGDVLICLGNIFHGATKNITNNDRRAFLFEFVSSIIEPRDRFNENVITENIINNFSARMIRLLYGGRERYHTSQTLRIKWLELMNNKKNTIMPL